MHSYFRMTKAALPHMGDGGRSSTRVDEWPARQQVPHRLLRDKGRGARVTYSLAQSLTPRGIRVNSVAPGPVWTPLIPSTMPVEKVHVDLRHRPPMGRPAQPDEIAPSYVFFASNRLSAFYTGEVIAPIGGETLPG